MILKKSYLVQNVFQKNIDELDIEFLEDAMVKLTFMVKLSTLKHPYQRTI